jgi:hypothetical protein
MTGWAALLSLASEPQVIPQYGAVDALAGTRDPIRARATADRRVVRTRTTERGRGRGLDMAASFGSICRMGRFSCDE